MFLHTVGLPEVSKQKCLSLVGKWFYICFSAILIMICTTVTCYIGIILYKLLEIGVKWL